MSNFNPATGLRYTVFAMHKLNQDLSHDLFYGSQARDVSYEQAMKEIEEEVKAEVAGELEDQVLDPELEEAETTYRIETRSENIQIEEPTIVGTLDGVDYEISWLGGGPLLFVIRSPHMGNFRLCSPCVPGACDGDNPDEDGYEGYDIPSDWKEQQT